MAVDFPASSGSSWWPFGGQACRGRADGSSVSLAVFAWELRHPDTRAAGRVSGGGDVLLHYRPSKRPRVRHRTRKLHACRDQTQRGDVRALQRIIDLDHSQAGQQTVSSAQGDQRRVVQNDHRRSPGRPAANSARQA